MIEHARTKKVLVNQPMGKISCIIAIPIAVIAGCLLTMALAAVGLTQGAGVSFASLRWLIRSPDGVVAVPIGLMLFTVVSIPSLLLTLGLLRIDALSRRPETIVLLVTVVAYIIPWWFLGLGADFRPMAGCVTVAILLAKIKDTGRRRRIWISAASLAIFCPVLMHIFPKYRTQAWSPIMEAMIPLESHDSISHHSMRIQCRTNGQPWSFSASTSGAAIDVITRNHPVGSRSDDLQDDLVRQGFRIENCYPGSRAAYIYRTESLLSVKDIRVMIVWKAGSNGRITQVGAWIATVSL